VPGATTPAPVVPPIPGTKVRTWDPAIDNTPPNPDGTYPQQPNALPPGVVELQIDFNGAFDYRKLSSALDLNLFECRAIVAALYQEINAPGARVTVDSACRVRVTDDIRLSGTIGDVIKKVRQYAVDRVEAKSYGDFDGSGERTAADYVLLQEAVFNPPDSPDVSRLYDLDGDNLLTSHDLTFWTLLGVP
jgi:hypothetical protein